MAAPDWHIDNASHSISAHCPEPAHWSDATNDAPNDKIIFAEIRKTHYHHVLNEFDAREITYSRTKTNSKGKAVKVGIKELIKVLKIITCPNEEVEHRSMSKDEQSEIRSFKPTYLMTP